MDEDSKLKVNKKKIDKTFVAENLDNNASIKEIVEVLVAKQKQHKLYNYYTSVMRQINFFSPHYLYTGHTLNAFSEEWDGGLNSGYFETFPYKSLMPKMITTKLKYIDQKDPVTDTLLKKIDWYTEWQTHKLVETKLKNEYEHKWLSEDVIYCRKSFLEMAKLWENNPDVYLDSGYNWYYGGNGNMHLVSIYGQDYLLHTELNCICLSPFNKDSLTIDYDGEITFKFSDETKILETVISEQIIAIRTKYKVTILKILENDNNLKIENLKDMESKLPFTGISFDEYHKNILYVTTLDFKLTIVNIDRMRGRSKQLRGKIETLVDNWSTVIGSERPYFTHVTKNSLTLYDKRTNNASERWTNLSNVTDHPTCNFISAAKYCKNKPLLYIGTNHHMFLIDMRFNKNEDKNVKAVQRWTHGMQCNPTYISICDFELNKNLVCLTSQWCEDMCVISNYACRVMKDFDIRSVIIPYRPPSVFATLHKAQMKMLCSDLHNPIQDRLATTITGQIVIENGHKYNVLMQNSFGDITSHTLCPENMIMFFEDDACEHLNKWSKLYKMESNDFEVSYLYDISKIWKKLKKVPESYKIGENKSRKTQGSNFNEQEIRDAFDNGDIDPGLKDVWMKDDNESMESEDRVEKPMSQLFFSTD